MGSYGPGGALSPAGIPGYDQKGSSAASYKANCGSGHFHSAIKDTPARPAACLRPWWLCGPQGLLAFGPLHLPGAAFILVLQPTTALAFLPHIHTSPLRVGQRTGLPRSHYLQQQPYPPLQAHQERPVLRRPLAGPAAG